MIHLYLSYKCPHCDGLNATITGYQPSGGTYLSYNTGDSSYPTDNRIEFTCVHCQKLTLFEVRLSPPL
ncbi:hypothetical protein KAR91_72105 [Candidatus Pacearchaeota archaeon]|nr:hypothetical protein [Candidatus Pacearchaeota archaeon]